MDDSEGELTPLAAVEPQSIVEVQNDLPGVGGGRGVFARSRLEPGTLVLAEIPVAVWPDASSLDEPEVLLSALELVCASEDAYAASKTLHPTTLEIADDAERERISSVWSDDILSELISTLSAHHNVRIERDDILRLALALQHNGFSSGLYHKLTLVNHSCQPNCIKFIPSSSTGWASEIWTTRVVEPGEELSICYCEPQEMTSTSMRAFLQAHHRFPCSCAKCRKRSVVAEPSVELQQMQDEVELMEKELHCTQGADAPLDVLKTMRAMIRAAEDMIAVIESMADAAVDSMDKAGVRVRLHKVCSNAAAALLEAVGALNHDFDLSRQRGPSGGAKDKKVKLAIPQTAAAQFLRHSLALRDAQQELLGDSHPDLARTLLDIDQGFSCLFTGDLFDAAARQATLDGLSAAYPWASNRALTKQEWSRCKLQGQRIKKLYSRHPRYSQQVSALKEPGAFFLPI